MRRTGITALGLAAAVAVGTALWAATASAGTATAGTASAGTPARATAPLCRTGDVSYYYGGYRAGLGARSFDITLLARPGVRCRLSDTPLIKLSPPYGKKEHIPVEILGRGGTLVLTPTAPLHAGVSYRVADTPQDSTDVYSLTLRMPGGGPANPEPFGYPGTVQIATQVGVGITSWQTGIGLDQGYGAY